MEQIIVSIANTGVGAGLLFVVAKFYGYAKQSNSNKKTPTLVLVITIVSILAIVYLAASGSWSVGRVAEKQAQLDSISVTIDAMREDISELKEAIEQGNANRTRIRLQDLDKKLFSTQLRIRKSKDENE